MIWVLLILRPESDLGVAVASWSLFHRSPRICFACQRVVTSRSGSTHNNVNLFFYESLQARQRFSDMSALRSWSLVTDITIEVPLPIEVFNMVFEAITFLGVMYVLPIEATISSLVRPLKVPHDQIGRPKEPLLSDLEENICPSRIKGDRW
ncbi:hypothetical protein BHM03_00014237 [Ensete ventricosum]|nr:hypothetical protein BHM03_00014237 [Ensete ventricosum]